MKPLSFDCAWHGLYGVQLLTSNLAAVDGAQWGEMFSRHLAGEKKFTRLMLCHPLRNPSGQIHPIKESNPVSFRGLCRSLQISIFSTHFTQSAAETRF